MLEGMSQESYDEVHETLEEAFVSDVVTTDGVSSSIFSESFDPPVYMVDVNNSLSVVASSSGIGESPKFKYFSFSYIGNHSFLTTLFYRCRYIRYCIWIDRIGFSNGFLVVSIRRTLSELQSLLGISLSSISESSSIRLCGVKDMLHLLGLFVGKDFHEYGHLCYSSSCQFTGDMDYHSKDVCAKFIVYRSRYLNSRNVKYVQIVSSYSM